MTAKRKSHPTYKSSNIDWLGEVPAHWRMRPMAYSTSMQGGCTPSKKNDEFWIGETPWVTPKDMKRFRIADSIDHVSESALTETGLRLLPEGVVLVVVRGMILAHTLPVAVTDAPVTVNQDMKALVPEPDIDSTFLAYQLRGCSSAFFAIVEESGHGTRVLRTDLWRRVELPVPPLDEQRAIAAFLDRETAKIDELIAKKRRLIELLAEKRTALISHAVTKGLNPDAPMKDSGIDWLGQIPAHWTVKRLKCLLTRIGSGKTPRGGAEVYVQEGVMLLRSQNIHDDGLRLQDVVFIDDEADKEMAGTRVRDADVLLNITGASIGRCSIVPPQTPRANVNQHVCILRTQAQLLTPPFLHAVLCSNGVKGWIRSQENGTSREGLNFRQIGNMTIAVPRRDEQTVIVGHLASRTEQLDALTCQVRNGIERLREYRSALISAAVTGKIDVRREA
jgi:type I restriction enzyme S subunit